MTPAAVRKIPHAVKPWNTPIPNRSAAVATRLPRTMLAGFTRIRAQLGAPTK